MRLRYKQTDQCWRRAQRKSRCCEVCRRIFEKPLQCHQGQILDCPKGWHSESYTIAWHRHRIFQVFQKGQQHCPSVWTFFVHFCLTPARWKRHFCMRSSQKPRFQWHGGVEPATGLVDPFGNVISRESLILVNHFFVLKGIVPLRIRHRTRIKPHVNKVIFAVHGEAIFTTQDNSINTVFMQVDLIIIFLIHVPHFKMVEGVSAINPASIERSMAVTNSSTEPMMILSFPSSVRQIGKGIPKNVSAINSNHWHWLASFKPAFSCRFRLPIDFVIVCHHFVTHFGDFDKPRI